MKLKKKATMARRVRRTHTSRLKLTSHEAKKRRKLQEISENVRQIPQCEN
jgi:hypothetical protein